MASIRKHDTGWRVEIYKKINGTAHRRSAVFTTKAEATSWAALTEANIISGKVAINTKKTVADLLLRYQLEVSPTKRGYKWEKLRTDLMMRNDVSNVTLESINESHIARWRDDRLKVVSAASVRREWNLLSNAFTVAVNEWKWLPSHPMKMVKRPPAPEARDRLFTPKEIETLTYILGYAPDSALNTVTSRVGAALLFALETAMRAGDIANLTWDCVTDKVAEVRLGKTAAARRRVPLTNEAHRILDQLPKTSDKCFDLVTAQIDSHFRKAKVKAKEAMPSIMELHFHDSRANAITKLSRSLEILDLAKAVGIKDLKILMVYYRDSAETIADRLRQFEPPVTGELPPPGL